MNKPFYLALSMIMFIFVADSCTGDDSDETTDEGTNNNVQLTITTTSITDITQIKATGGGEISNGGDETVLAKGVVWSTSNNPTLNDNFTVDGSGAGSYSSAITGLEVTSRYYVRAYVTTGSGTIYGNEVSFSTLEHKVFDAFILFSTQIGIDLFFGSEGYSKITYGFRIEEDVPGNITSLAALESLIDVGSSITNTSMASIQIWNNTNLTNIDGLQNIKNIGGSVYFFNNPSLSSIESFPSITEIPGPLSLKQLPALIDISPLDNLITIGGSFEIKDTGIQYLTGLQNLISVGGHLEIENNDSLLHINELTSLTLVALNFSIKNSQINNLNSLLNLQSVGYNMFVEDNPLLSDFCGLVPLITNNGLSGSLITNDNAYNPSKQDILDGNCSI